MEPKEKDTVKRGRMAVGIAVAVGGIVLVVATGIAFWRVKGVALDEGGARTGALSSAQGGTGEPNTPSAEPLEDGSKGGGDSPDTSMPSSEADAADDTATNAEFQKEKRDFLGAKDEFTRMRILEAWVGRNEKRAFEAVVSFGAGAGRYERGALLDALGRLGRLHADELLRARAADVSIGVIVQATQRPDAAGLGDGLIACDTLVTLGKSLSPAQEGELVGLFMRKTLPWPLAHRLVLTLEALGSARVRDAADALAQALVRPPNAMFERIPAEERAEIEDDLARILEG